MVEEKMERRRREGSERTPAERLRGAVDECRPVAGRG